MSKYHKSSRKSPPFPANDYPEDTKGVGNDGKVYITKYTDAGYKRWCRHYHSSGESYVRDTRMVGYDEWLRDKTMSDDESYRGDEIGIESPMSVEEETPDEGLKGLEAIFSGESDEGVGVSPVEEIEPEVEP